MPQVLNNFKYTNDIPQVGLGTWQTDDSESVHRAIENAIDAGYRLIDTAFAYMNERFIGESLQKVFDSGKVCREDMYIITKLPLNGLQVHSVEHFCNLSLKALQLEYIDLYLIHFPVGTKRTENDEDIMPFEDDKPLLDYDVDLQETWKAMEKLIDKGLVKSIGLSNFNSQQIKRIYDKAKIKPACLEVECHAYLGQEELLDLCQNLNISFIAYAPLGTPGLPEYVRKNTQFKDFNPDKLLDDSRLLQISKNYEKTPAQILLRFLVQRGMTVIPKSSNPQRIKENIQLFDFQLEDEDMEILKSMNKGLRYFPFDLHKSILEHPDYPFNVPF